MEINFQNIEETFFLDRKVQDLLPEFKQQFDSWKISQMVPGLKPLAQKSLFEVLNNIDKKQIEKLEKHFGTNVYINKLNNKVVQHYNFNEYSHDELCQFSEYKDFCITANKDGIKATFWR